MKGGAKGGACKGEAKGGGQRFRILATPPKNILDASEGLNLHDICDFLMKPLDSSI